MSDAFVAKLASRITEFEPRMPTHAIRPRDLCGTGFLVSVLACTSSLDLPEVLTGAQERARPRNAADAVAPRALAEENANPGPEPTASPSGEAVAGFVIYTVDETIILGVDGSAPTSATGLWVQDDRTTPPAVTHALVLTRTTADALGLPACPCLGLAGACELGSEQVHRFEPVTGAMLPTEATTACTCVTVPDEYGFAEVVHEDGESYEPCRGDSGSAVVSIVGGALYTSTWDWNGGCYDTLSSYEAFAYETPLVAFAYETPLVDAPSEPSSVGMRLLDCYGVDDSTVRPWPRGFRGMRLEAAACDVEWSESEFFMIRRGDLWAVQDTMGVDGTRAYLHRPVRPGDCPGVNDPCGDPGPFRALAGLDKRKREYWIATDGGTALTAVGHDYELWRVGEAAAIRWTLPTAHAMSDVIGVRTHTDVSRLRALVAEHPDVGASAAHRAPSTMTTEACLAAWGGPADPRRVLGLTIDPAPRPRNARTLGEKCRVYLSLGQWVLAERNCLEGLALANELGTRGAILYNLGRIAEAQGSLAQAVSLYRESLAVRPGNAIVARHLARLAHKTASSGL